MHTSTQAKPSPFLAVWTLFIRVHRMETLSFLGTSVVKTIDEERNSYLEILVNLTAKSNKLF